MITLGKTYKEKYLDTKIGKLGTSQGGLITLKRTKKPYGWHILQGTNFISIHTTRLEVFEDGRAKAVTKVDKNYHAKYQVTTYYNKDGKEIISNDNSTRKELSYFKKL